MSIVYFKGDATTPQRFWELGLSNDETHNKFYELKGFVKSEKYTQEYIGLSEKKKKEVKFDYVNGEKIVY
jgi:hypothetical protein